LPIVPNPITQTFAKGSYTHRKSEMAVSFIKSGFLFWFDQKIMVLFSLFKSKHSPNDFV